MLRTSPLFRCLQVFRMSCPSERRSLIRVATLVDLVNRVKADSVQGSPFDSASRMIDLVSVCVFIF